MYKKRSIKFWLIFWVAAILFLIGWFFFWQTRFGGTEKIGAVLDYLPVGKEQLGDYKTLITLADYFTKKDSTEKTFLVLFQNNLEIRPGGGYIGSFGILKVKNGQIQEIQTHDLSNFDARIPDTFEPPYPMKETLRISSWKLRDSNFSPDFPTNAKKAEEFYHLGKGEEQFDAVIAITSNVLTSVLKVTGPVQIEDYPGTYDSENAVISLEYQVEKGYAQQGIEKGERKSVMNLLAAEISKRVSGFNSTQKLELAKIILEDLKKKDIQLYFKNSDLQKSAEETNWAGAVDQNWSKDYLMTVDANLGAYKSDYYVKRLVDYSIDLTQEKPVAHLRITYNHTAKQKDFMTRDYLTYLRVYVPDGSWLTNWQGADSDPKFGTEFGKKFFGAIVKVPLGQSKTVELTYTLPENVKNEYDLKIQKQAGINDVPIQLHITDSSGIKNDYSFTINSDIVLNNQK
ncbi:MAG: DUF4012 domain-containing protein [Candidatus Moranbacteria bacterium]|nr:DUF4012 domain-containing protein [Candidatus Moranbacteria bacterium]